MNSIAATICVGLMLYAATGMAKDESVVEVTASGTFDDVKQQLVLAIENRGLVVNHESRVGEMLERTGKDLGAEQQIYSRAEVLEFCSAALSRQAMQADPRLLAYCPYGVGIYQLPGEPGQVHLVYRRPLLPQDHPAAGVTRRIDRLLHEIVQDAGQ